MTDRGAPPAPPPFAQPPQPQAPFTQPPEARYEAPAPPQLTQPPEIRYGGFMRNAEGYWVPDTTAITPFQSRAPAAPTQNQQHRIPSRLPCTTHPLVLRAPPPISTLHIDPRLIALPVDDDHDISDPPTIAKSHGLKPAHKVAGSRQEGKGKKRQYSSNEAEDSDGPVNKRGRPQGSSNFSKADTKKLLDLTEKELPLGQKGWEVIKKGYSKWARANDRPERPGKSLENKYKQMLRTKKPTGNVSCPPNIKCAHRIEAQINQRAGTRDLNDSELDGAAGGGDSSDDGSIEILDEPDKIHTAEARRAPTPSLRRNPRINAPELVSTLSRAFDPAAQKSRDDEQAQRSFQNTHILTLSQQIRDQNTVIEGLRTQLSAAQSHAHEVEHARDRAELMNQFYNNGFTDAAAGPSHRSRRSAYPDFARVNGKVRCEEVYPDGGRCTYWLTDDGSSDDEADKENIKPCSPSPLDLSLSSSGLSSFTSSSAFRRPVLLLMFRSLVVRILGLLVIRSEHFTYLFLDLHPLHTILLGHRPLDPPSLLSYSNHYIIPKLLNVYKHKFREDHLAPFAWQSPTGFGAFRTIPADLASPIRRSAGTIIAVGQMPSALESGLLYLETVDRF
ncbi:hypothetical protein B0H17DRAFT_1245356 [Mycena rosella]|uniref:DUF6818 domain-containing protein n=1 Tax=Mycena rosella TaxID=1033263 RepID=A0AAD7CZG0_MYCRO|nr:hypothetical protein B0H17DRAFT_1245356 [Mycena rosella]